MSYPTKYTRQYDYVAYQNANPNRPLPATSVHADLNQVALSTTEIIDFLKKSLRSDGAIMNGVVGADQLSADVAVRLGIDLAVISSELQAVSEITGSGIVRRPAPGQWTAGGAVLNSELATMPSNTFKGNVSGSPAVPADLTAAQVTAALPVVTTSAKGLVPLPPNDATKYLDGTGNFTFPLKPVADGTIKSNISGSTAAPSDNTITAVLDKQFGTTQGSLVYRSVAQWVALAPGSPGQALTQGAGAPAWANSVSVLATGATTPRDLAAWAASDPFIEDFGGGVGVADNTPAFNAAVAAGMGVRFRDTFDKGTYHFTTAPSIIAKSFRISGANDNLDGLVFISRDYVEGTSTRGLFHWTTGQPYVQGLFILAGNGSSGGAGISIIPGVGGSGGPGGIRHVRVSVSGTGTWSYSLYVDGSNLTSPIGVRTLYLTNVTLFGASIRCAFFKSVVHLDWHGGSTVQAGGVDGSLEITGTASAPSSENIISLDYATNNIVLDRVSNTIINVAEIGGSITNTANTSGIIGSGVILGSAPQSNWLNSSWRDGGRIFSQLVGTATNDNANAGNVGEYVESVVPSGSATALTSGAAKTITSISLTAGDWDVSGIAYFSPAATTSITIYGVSFSGTTNTLDTTAGKFNFTVISGGTVTGGSVIGSPLSSYRLSLSAPTTVFLVAQATFTVSTASGYGIIRARRVR